MCIFLKMLYDIISVTCQQLLFQVSCRLKVNLDPICQIQQFMMDMNIHFVSIIKS